MDGGLVWSFRVFLRLIHMRICLQPAHQHIAKIMRKELQPWPWNSSGVLILGVSTKEFDVNHVQTGMNALECRTLTAACMHAWLPCAYVAWRDQQSTEWQSVMYVLCHCSWGRCQATAAHYYTTGQDHMTTIPLCWCLRVLYCCMLTVYFLSDDPCSNPLPTLYSES